MLRVQAALVDSACDHSPSATKVWLLVVKLQKKWPNARPREYHTKNVCSLPRLRDQFKAYRCYFKLHCSQTVVCFLIINVSLQLNTP